MNEIENKIAEINDPHARALLNLWMPALQRWVSMEGWDQLRYWLYVFPRTRSNQLDWWITIRARMTVEEARAEDKRRLEAVKLLAKNAEKIIAAEQKILQDFFTVLITALIGRL